MMRITHGDKILLARSPHFTLGVYSVLAGFIEPGETAEEAVIREVREEVGLEIKNITYFGSQPWPFPSNLMLGFTAEYASGNINMDPKEIEDAQWFSLNQLPILPQKISLARQMIDNLR
jgi:NAD+ diphosphatase